MTVKALFTQAQRMSRTKRARLAEMLMASVADESPVDDATSSEIKRRMAYAEKNPDCWIPWEEVKADLKARRRKRCAR